MSSLSFQSLEGTPMQTLTMIGSIFSQWQLKKEDSGGFKKSTSHFSFTKASWFFVASPIILEHIGKYSYSQSKRMSFLQTRKFSRLQEDFPDAICADRSPKHHAEVFLNDRKGR